MKILFVHSIGRKKYGGGERWVINAASGLQQHGNHVIVAGVKNSVLLNEAKKEGLTTLNLNVSNDWNLIQALWLSRYIRNNKFDIIICKGRELFVTGLAVRWGGNPVLIRRTGSPPPSRSRKLAWRTRIFVDGVITNTHTIREIYENHGFTTPGFVKVIYNGLKVNDDIAAYDFSVNSPGKKIILCVGRVAAHKGYFYLIDALAILKSAHPHLLVYVLGDGRDREQLIKYSNDKGVGDMIKFAGYIHDPVPYFKGCDMFVHPSLYEGMPNAAMEAMAYGKPAIITRVNGAEELSNNGRYAWLIPPADTQAIADAIVQSQNQWHSFSTMAEEAKEYVRSTFGRETMIGQLHDYLRERIEKKIKTSN